MTLKFFGGSGIAAIAALLFISVTAIDAQNKMDPDGTTPLHWAVHRNDLKAAANLIRAGADVNATNRYGVPPLSLAATNGNAAMLELLLKAGRESKCCAIRGRDGAHDRCAHGRG